MKIEIIADTVDPYLGNRITTFSLCYPRYIHAQVLTHRVFSRNAQSSRAIPVKRMIKYVRENMVIPSSFAKNKKGMQPGEIMSTEDQEKARFLWLEAAENALKSAELMEALGVHKQWVNRLLEPYSYINVVITATDWDNYFDLRAHEDAQDEIDLLAKGMRTAMKNSHPSIKKVHLPYIVFNDKDANGISFSTADALSPFELELSMRMASVGKCARVSYVTFDSSRNDYLKDIKLCIDLFKSGHWSPFEHVAISGEARYYFNLYGWENFRHLLSNTKNGLQLMEDCYAKVCKTFTSGNS